METTVTMSINRYKELESAEVALYALGKQPTMLLYKSSYGEWMCSSESQNADLINQLKQAVEARDETLKNISRIR